MKEFLKRLNPFAKRKELERQLAEATSKLETERVEREAREAREAQRLLDEAAAAAAKPTEKEVATAAKEPWVHVNAIDVDRADPKRGSFEIDWNVYFVEMLRKNGFVGKTDEEVVDQWFSDVCKHIVLETYEQEQADPSKRVNKKDLGGGKSEFS